MGIDTQHRFKQDSSVERSSNEVLFIGRLVEKKGLKHLLDAISEAAKTIPGLNLTIIGGGPERDALEKKSVELGIADQVNFLGCKNNTDLPPYYQRAAVFVAPFVTAQSGDEEGYGLVVAEALCCDCPVIVTTIDATRDIRALYPDKKKLLGVSPAASKEISSAIINLMQTKYTTDQENLNEFRNAVDWRTSAAKYAEALNECD
jgi:glycosyltransferase involved in cell wall biosynthesis